MDVVRAALEEMTCRYDADIETALPTVMDATLARQSGPFQTFEESLVAFAEANYALRLDPQDGRCVVEGLAGCKNRYYDPNRTYTAPPLENELNYGGSTFSYSGDIPASFGMDLIEIHLDEDQDGQPLRIVFQGEGRFSVQVWELGGGAHAGMGSTGNTAALSLASDTGRGGEQLYASTPHPRTLDEGNGNSYIEWIPNLDILEWDRLALIVVRLDAQDEADSTGEYTITLESAFTGSSE
jgi:hypothetical protein